jgi:hypothetical protein
VAAKKPEPDAEIVTPEEGDEPKEGDALNLSGEEISQVGKHPDLPVDIPVQAGTALDPALPPLAPQQTRVEPED